MGIHIMNLANIMMAKKGSRWKWQLTEPWEYFTLSWANVHLVYYEPWETNTPGVLVHPIYTQKFVEHWES